jgi:copper chaperone CopZ
MKRFMIIAAMMLAACASPTQQLSADDYAQQHTMTVTGMSCPNCANNITHELKALPGVDDVRIDMGSGAVIALSNSELPPAFQMEQAIRDAGFTPVEPGQPKEM